MQGCMTLGTTLHHMSFLPHLRLNKLISKIPSRTKATARSKEQIRLKIPPKLMVVVCCIITACVTEIQDAITS